MMLDIVQANTAPTALTIPLIDPNTSPIMLVGTSTTPATTTTSLEDKIKLVVAAPPHHTTLTTRNHRVVVHKKQPPKSQQEPQKQAQTQKTRRTRTATTTTTSSSSPRRRRSKRHSRRRRAVVQFNEQANQYYDNTHMTRDQVAALWHTNDDFIHFRLVHKHCVGLVRNNALVWMDPHSIPATLLRIYNTFATAQSVEDVEPIWNAPQLYHHPCLVGLERATIGRIVVDYGRRRRECLDQIAWLQSTEAAASIPKQADDDDRAALIRLACRQHSRAARLYARFVGDLVARTP